MHLEEMNWMDVEKYLENGDRIMLVIGSCEQHGYLSLLTDTKIPLEIAGRVSQESGVPVAPPLSFGFTASFLDYPGTVSLRISTLLDVIEDIVRSFYGQGFRRMLLLMKSQIEAMRGVMYKTGEAIDLAAHHPDAATRAAATELAAILTPVSKAWGTDLGVELASLGMQVHGGVGYVEESGAPQWWRDARIAPIYEGTNGIQAMDLAARKLPLREGQGVGDLLAEMRGVADCLDGELAPIGERLGDAVDTLEAAGNHLLARLPEDPNDALAGATPYA